jgi:hypothetical protein
LHPFPYPQHSFLHYLLKEIPVKWFASLALEILVSRGIASIHDFNPVMHLQTKPPNSTQGTLMACPVRTQVDPMSIPSLLHAASFEFQPSLYANRTLSSRGPKICGKNMRLGTKHHRRWHSEHDGLFHHRRDDPTITDQHFAGHSASLIPSKHCRAKSHTGCIEDTLRLSSPDDGYARGLNFSPSNEDRQLLRLRDAHDRFQRSGFPILSPAKDLHTHLPRTQVPHTYVDPQGYDGSRDSNLNYPSSSLERTSSEDTGLASTAEQSSTHFPPDEDIMSMRSLLDWLGPNNGGSLDETKRDDHGLFTNPFNNDNDLFKESSATSGSSTYLRPNAFAGHRDTFARILHSQLFEGYEENSASGSLSNNATPTRRPSAYNTIPHAVLQMTFGYLSFSDYKLLRLVCRQWCKDLPEPSFSALYRLPPELVQQILSYLSPCDFDAARHTCAAWCFASQDRRLQAQMLRLGCCKSAFEEDLRLHRSPAGKTTFPSGLRDIASRRGATDLSRLDQEWICGKRLATESRLSPDWRGRDTAQASFAPRVFLIEETDFSKLLDSGNGMATRARFTVSACRKFVLVSFGSDISIFSLCDRKDTLKPIVRLAAGVEVLKVSMDTSSERYAVAALLAGRKGMLWELLGNMTQTRYRSSSGEPISLGMQADVQSSALSPVSRDVALNLSMRTAEFRSAGAPQYVLGNSSFLSDSPSPPIVPSPPSY